MSIIGHGERQRNLEYPHRVREVDLVFPPIGDSLPWIPLIVYEYKCMYKCAQLSMGNRFWSLRGSGRRGF